MSEREVGFEGWAILELMGHRRLGGRVSEAMVAGSAFIRIDVPHPNDSTLFRATHFYSPAAVHSITPTTGEIACAIARGGPEPVSRWDLRARTTGGGELDQAEVLAMILDALGEADEWADN